MSSIFFVFLAYFTVFVALALFVIHTFYVRKNFLAKLQEEGFLNIESK